MTLAERVARRHLERQASEADDALPRIDRALTSVKTYRDELAGQVQLIGDLVRAGEARRLDRVAPIRPTDVKFDGKRITATVQGTSGTYDTRITLPPARGHHCTCPDWQKNGKTVGPCKHVLALGLYWRDQRLDRALMGLENRLDDILTHSEV